MALAFTPKAKEDLEHWDKSGTLSIKKRIESLLKSIGKYPYSGIGKPKPLKHELSGCWSRRIDKKNRLVYQVTDGEIVVISLRYHY